MSTALLTASHAKGGNTRVGGGGTGLHKIRHFSPKWGQPRLVTLIFHSKKMKNLIT